MANKIYDYLTPGDYIYDSNKIEVSGGLAKLKENLTNVYARWHLNEATGLTVLDSSGNGRDGSPINSPASVAGKLNNCLQFNGTNQYVNCGNIGNFERTDTFSLEGRIKTSSSSAQVIMSKNERSGLYRGWMFYMVGGNIILYLIANSTSNLIQVTLNTAIDDGIWHHIIITYNGSSLGSGVNIYLDGSLGSTTINTDTLSNSILTPVNCNIGAMDDIEGFFDGLIDEVVIYDRELTPAEVAYRYNSGIGRENFIYYIDKPTIEPTDLFDPTTVTYWESFLETLGGGNQGSIGYNLYKVDKVNKYYWNGSAWVTGGDENNYNSVATINTNIGSFDTSPDKIGFIAYLISDGEQIVELDENQITYTVNEAPLINAGSNKSTLHETSIAPFSDCSFSDVDGTIDHVYYDIEGSGWIEILQGGYGSLQEAVQAFTYLFNNTGDITCNLRVEDNVGTTSDDSLIVTVEHYTVTFNCKDSQGNHLANINFKPGDGTGYQTKNSPFIYEYEYNVSGWNIIVDKDGYGIQTQNVPTTDHTENFTLISLIDTSDFLDKMKRLLGLSQENYRIINPSYDGNNNLISATIKTYPTKADTNADTNVMATYTMTASYDVSNNMTDYKCVRES